MLSCLIEQKTSKNKPFFVVYKQELFYVRLEIKVLKKEKEIKLKNQPYF